MSIHTALALFGSAGAHHQPSTTTTTAVLPMRCAGSATTSPPPQQARYWCISGSASTGPEEKTLLRYVGAPTDFETAVAYHIPALVEQGKKNCTNCADGGVINSEKNCAEFTSNHCFEALELLDCIQA